MYACLFNCSTVIYGIENTSIYIYIYLLLLLVVSLHQSDPLSDTFFSDIVVNHEIIKRASSVAAAGTRGDAPSSDQLLYNHTWCHPHLYISTLFGCVCSVPFSCGVCSGISIQSIGLMHHFLDTHLGFVVACGVQIAGAETTAPICEWMGSGSVRLWHVWSRFWI